MPRLYGSLECSLEMINMPLLTLADAKAQICTVREIPNEWMYGPLIQKCTLHNDILYICH